MYGTLGVHTGIERFLHDCSAVFTANGCVFLVSSMVDRHSAFLLPKLFYVSSSENRPFQQSPLACCHLSILCCGYGVWNASPTGVTAIVCGGFHLAHGIYATLGA
ncbi:unnamed protein product [Ixodes persulcatus]